ncbi:beta-1,6-N-acetylglucosaminyltransferase [Emticicia sp. BO119]|uniref:beta-1,6-N-acetylglucosaminyltransferase n=1 Tax=Emticicia sp. BO119 TaxID=2757768 RepID=UPI0015EFDF92|nr:beta-1,6-N-acetylglucosaminyltransferase [Emticicia sp. BO119]MBA4852670.1 glycosyl transferase [Emticicia sp. BO119]
MKIAHLILTHANPTQLKRLIESLVHPEADFYIHVDLKAAIEPFLPLANNQVFFVQNRVKVYWGAYSIVQATVNSFKQILSSHRKYDYVNLMSGQDYALKSTEAIHAFFAQNPDKAFMDALLINSEWQEALPKLTKYHFVNYHFKGRYVVEKIVNLFAPLRKMPNNLIPVGRTQWFSMSLKHVEYIVEYLEENQNVRRFFEMTWGCDEIIFQTILYNSQYRKDIVNDSLRYIDWSEGNASPKTFTIVDFPALMESGKLFARKFSLKDSAELLDELDKVKYNYKEVH